MPFDYETNVAAIQNVLLAHNTTTASPDLSSGLTTRVRNVLVDDPEITAIQWDDLPAIYVRVISADEEAASLGPTGPTGVRKTKNATYELVGMYIRDGASGLGRTHLTEVYRLAENLEGVFQAESNLSSTALWCHPASTNFGAFGLGEGSRVKGFVTTLRARYHFR